MRHEIEERESKANRREEEGNARDGDLRIDLASGVAVIGIPARPGADQAVSGHAADGEQPDAATDTAAAPAGSPAPPVKSSARTSGERPVRERTTQARRPAPTGRSRPSVADAETGAEQSRPAPRPASKAGRAAR